MAAPGPRRLNQRAGPGAVTNTSRQRTALAIRFDGAADAMIRKAVKARGGWVIGYVYSPGRQFRHLDAGGLTANERAFQQALYYHQWIYLWGSGYDAAGERARNPYRRYSLVRTWGPVVKGPDGRQYRQLRVRIKRPGNASLWAKGQGWTG